MEPEQAHENTLVDDGLQEWIGSLYRRENDTEPFDFYVRKELFITRSDHAQLETKYRKLNELVEVKRDSISIISIKLCSGCHYAMSFFF